MTDLKGERILVTGGAGFIGSREMAHHRRIAVVGLGYVGLPVAAAFSRAGSRVVAFDISSSRIQEGSFEPATIGRKS